ncbi:chorismate mutase prephenate dehydratase [Grosmannia clavigera kw1407]|uniref:prephenate dehydratase n=1 Tax=Grosmannia clavigera (strain kw1407 / UAMH 11150) TaxID=655863 RepID=F0XHL8_GROCL|nr:chorismate mutase prephenate dehydratase [Grosmannia clavigera kw1407]EFX02602.1 chorismate mutase prephenate dehydratase [Grosmannia clavigera kw1407]
MDTEQGHGPVPQSQGKHPAVAFLGPVSSYTHQAAKSVFPGDEWELLPVATIKDVFEAVRLGRAAFGVTPFENSTHGPVTFTLAALADRDGAYGSLTVCDEVYLAVHHYLLGRRQKPAVEDEKNEKSQEDRKGVPLARLDHIARLYSHPQGFGQTTAFVRAHLAPGVETIDASSTSRAAELAAADPTGTSAAISSALAAETTGLDVLARCIEDRADNTTRFYVLGMKGATETKIQKTQKKTIQDQSKSLVSFTVPHRSPGALADALDCFRRAGLNLTSINSLPSLVQPFQYLFFVEFAADRPADKTDDDPDQRIRQALAGLADVAETWRLLGTWTKRD